MVKLTVDEFVKTRCCRNFKPIVTIIRELMKEYAPNATEVIKLRNTGLQNKKDICGHSAQTRKGITFSFTHGTEFEDKYNLLRGVGKVSRHVKIKNLADANKEALRYYVKQALEIEAK